MSQSCNGKNNFKKKEKDENFTYSMMMEEYKYHNLVRQLNEKRINIWWNYAYKPIQYTHYLCNFYKGW